jgi:hypothetical protein
MIKWTLFFLALCAVAAATVAGGFAESWFGVSAYIFFLALQLTILFAVLSKVRTRAFDWS